MPPPLKRKYLSGAAKRSAKEVKERKTGEEAKKTHSLLQLGFVRQSTADQSKASSSLSLASAEAAVGPDSDAAVETPVELMEEGINLFL